MRAVERRCKRPPARVTVRGIIIHDLPATAVTYRTRLTLALVGIALVPVAILGFGVRREMTARLDAEAVRRTTAAESVVVGALRDAVQRERDRLEGVVTVLARDARFRAAVATGSAADRRWLADWARTAGTAAGLTMLRLQDSTGRILSSGHSRAELEGIAAELPRLVVADPRRVAVVELATTEGVARSLVTTQALNLRGATFTVTGGTAFDAARVAKLSTDPTVTALLLTGDTPTPAGARVAATLAFLDDAAPRRPDSARVVLLHDDGPTLALKAGVDRWLTVTLGVTLVVALTLAALLARRVAAPIVALGERTARLDLDTLDTRFATGRDDEVGALERTLDALTGRLRTSVARLRDAERAAVTGDLARQVNHDIKNGLAPIRNVLRHLGELSDRDPAMLAPVFAERRGTLESSVEYLDALARNYARLSPTLGRGPTDAREAILKVARGVSGARVELRLPEALPPVRTDAVVLHRILDNLVTNAVESLEGRDGTVTIVADVTGAELERRVRITVTDTGRGMSRRELDRAFDDFFTTKPTGTGLGLSVVRRLLADLGGSVRAESAPGEGTSFTVEIPA